jgi:hypothetical protein
MLTVDSCRRSDGRPGLVIRHPGAHRDRQLTRIGPPALRGEAERTKRYRRWGCLRPELFDESTFDYCEACHPPAYR